MFQPDSRYARTPNGTFTDEHGRTFEYKRRRRIPRSAGPNAVFAEVGPVVRPDQVAARILGHPTYFWHLCDINAVIDPNDIATPGRYLTVTPLADPRT